MNRIIKNKITSRPEKLKQYSRKNLYTKIYPSFIRKNIPDDLLTSDGYTKEKLIKDIYKIIDCNNKITYVNTEVRASKDLIVNGKVIGKKGNIVKKIKPFEMNSCNIYALCSICAEKLSRRRRKKYKNDIENLARKYKYTYMMTFTTASCTTFNESYKNLRIALRKYLLKGQLRGVKNTGEEMRGNSEVSKIKAMALSIEIKKGANKGLWHVHGHAIVFCADKLSYSIYDQEKKKILIAECKAKYNRKPLKEELNKLILEYGYIDKVDKHGEIIKTKIPVSPVSRDWINATSGQSCNINVNLLKGTSSEKADQCIEVIKYVSKISSFTSDDMIEILLHRKNKRFFSTYGELYKREPKNIQEDEEILKTETITGYVWRNKEEKLLPMQKEELKKSKERYDKRELIYKAQGLIMKAYYQKKDILELIMKETIKAKKNNNNWKIYKLATITHINDLEAAYSHTKKIIYTKVLNAPYQGKILSRKTPIQKMYIQRVDHVLQSA